MSVKGLKGTFFYIFIVIVSRLGGAQPLCEFVVIKVAGTDRFVALDGSIYHYSLSVDTTIIVSNKLLIFGRQVMVVFST